MGKIFDALEKANNQVAKTIPLTRPRPDSKENASGAENVMALVNPNRVVHEYHLDPNLITFHAPQSVEAELFKVLRTNLLFPQSGKRTRKILVTSALPSEGKSFVSSNLAVSIAQGIEEYVLLIDGDVRRPAIHNYFGFGQVAGLTEYLSAGVDIEKVLLKSPIPKLTIFPAGRIPKNPTELLSSKKMKALLEEVTNRYDDRYIIIDSPPPSMASETNAIVNFVDGVIIVIKSGKTPKKAVAETIEKIGKDKILGIVLNHSDQTIKKYYGYGKPYYGNKEN